MTDLKTLTPDDLEDIVLLGLPADYDDYDLRAVRRSMEAAYELVRRAESVAAVAREAYILGAKAAHEDTVEGRYNCDPGYTWDCDPQILADAIDNVSRSA